MFHRPAFWILAVAGSVVMCGCQSPERQDRSPAPSVLPSGQFSQPQVRHARKRSRDGQEMLPEAMARYAAGISEDANGKPERALEEFYRSALAHPGNEMFVLDTAIRLLREKQPQRALDVLIRASQMPETGGDVFALMASGFLQLGQTNKALASGRAALRKSPRTLPGCFHLADTWFKLDQAKEAARIFPPDTAAVEADIPSALVLAELYLKQPFHGDKQKSEIHKRCADMLTQIRAMPPPNPALLQKTADLLALAGDWRQASEIYLEMIGQYTQPLMFQDLLRERLANIFLMAGQREQSAEQLNAILRGNPTKYPQVYYVLGSIAFGGKQYSKAAEYFRQATLLEPGMEQAYYDWAGALINGGHPEDALIVLDKVRGRFSQSFILEFYSGLANQRMKQYAAAIRHFTTAEIIAAATDKRRLDPLFYFQTGAAYERNGDHGQAEQYFLKTLEQKPDDAETLNYLGYMWADRGINLKKAREFIGKALKLAPDNPAYLDSMGWVLFKSGRTARALPFLLKSARLAKEPDPTIYDHIGDVYHALKQPEKAREYWLKSLEIEPNETIRIKTLPPP